MIILVWPLTSFYKCQINFSKHVYGENWKSQCFQELLEADVAYLTQIGYQPKPRKYVDVQVTVNGWSLTVGAKSHGLAFQPTSPLKPLGQLLPYLASQGQRNESLFKGFRFVNQDGLEAMIITYLVHTLNSYLLSNLYHAESKIHMASFRLLKHAKWSVFALFSVPFSL